MGGRAFIVLVPPILGCPYWWAARKGEALLHLPHGGSEIVDPFTPLARRRAGFGIRRLLAPRGTVALRVPRRQESLKKEAGGGRQAGGAEGELGRGHFLTGGMDTQRLPYKDSFRPLIVSKLLTYLSNKQKSTYSMFFPNQK